MYFNRVLVDVSHLTTEVRRNAKVRATSGVAFSSFSLIESRRFLSAEANQISNVLLTYVTFGIFQLESIWNFYFPFEALSVITRFRPFSKKEVSYS
jgi:hypothetical protein